MVRAIYPGCHTCPECKMCHWVTGSLGLPRDLEAEASPTLLFEQQGASRQMPLLPFTLSGPPWVSIYTGCPLGAAKYLHLYNCCLWRDRNNRKTEGITRTWQQQRSHLFPARDVCWGIPRCSSTRTVSFWHCMMLWHNFQVLWEEKAMAMVVAMALWSHWCPIPSPLEALAAEIQGRGGLYLPTFHHGSAAATSPTATILTGPHMAPCYCLAPRAPATVLHHSKSAQCLWGNVHTIGVCQHWDPVGNGPWWLKSFAF